KEHQQWQGSHHDLAMQLVNEQTVLGDFYNARFTKQGVTSTFFKQDGRFMVNTDGADNTLQDYEISYTFGVYPLQQYMVKFPQGKIQVLDIAWDSRSKDEGGQRWFSLHPDESIKGDDVLHWTGPNMNWNFMCADCHSTNLKKNYNPAKQSYNTQWDAINVSCEACHGPASEHLNWAKSPEKKTHTQNKGLTINLSAATKNHWQINPQTRKPELLNDPNAGKLKVELCAKCHSRRSQLDDDFVPGDNFRDHYLPSLLPESLYYPDGKIKDEVYVYGSFIQSRMYQAGVTCSDCHNPHTLERKASGDKVCAQCHLTSDYASAKHHFHKDESTGASCIACHMPSKIYMGVDDRNDHSFRIPRPDLAAQLAMPDACTNCHTDKNSRWASDAIKQWYGKTPLGYQQFGQALNALQQQNEQALRLAYQVLLSDAPTIAKATVIGYLGGYPSRQTLTTSLQMLRSKEADMRVQGLQALQGFPMQHTVMHIFSLLNDPVKIVRMHAASFLVTMPRGSLEKEQADLLNKVTEEYQQSLLFSADRPESQLALAQLYQQQGLPAQAESAFKQALILQPKYVPAYANYANFLQQQGKEIAAFKILQRGLIEIKNAALYHALGLWYVRNQDKEKARVTLQKAAEMEPDNIRYQYVYAIAVGEKQPQAAIKILENTLKNHTGNMDLLMALVSYYQQLGDEASARKFHQQSQRVMQTHN
ncbi:MAG: hypothetical protein DRQ44_17310, partial [Gammaproteobacteria bacterium]